MSVGCLVSGWWPLVERGNAFEVRREFQVGMQSRSAWSGCSRARARRDAGGVDAGVQGLIAQVCRSVCGVTFFPVSEGHLSAAVAACRVTASQRQPWSGGPAVGREQRPSRWWELGRADREEPDGVLLQQDHALLRPFPTHSELAVWSAEGHPTRRLMSSLTRSPVWMPGCSRSRSRRPNQVRVSGRR